MPDLRTGAEWDRLIKRNIMDPDGWDRMERVGGVYFDSTKISLKEFLERSMHSTTMGNSKDSQERVRLFGDIHMLKEFRNRANQ